MTTYSQYIADAAFLLFGIITISVCAKRGFFLTLLKFFKMTFSVVAAYFWGDAFGVFIGEKFLNATIREGVFNKVNEIYLNATEGFSAQSILDSIPEFLKSDSLVEKLNALDGSGTDLVNSITDTVAGALSSVVCAILGYLAVFLAAFLALSLIYAIIKGVKGKIRLFGSIDSLLGAVLGFVLSWIVLLVAGSVMKFFFEADPVYADSVITKFFGESTLLDTLKWLDINGWLNSIHELGLGL